LIFENSLLPTMATYYDVSSFDTWTDDGVTYQGVLTPEGEYHYWVVHGVGVVQRRERYFTILPDEAVRSPIEDDEPSCRACRHQTDDGHTEEKGCMFGSDSSEEGVSD